MDKLYYNFYVEYENGHIACNNIREALVEYKNSTSEERKIVYLSDSGQAGVLLSRQQEKNNINMPDYDLTRMDFKDKKRLKNSYELIKLYVSPDEVRVPYMPQISVNEKEKKI